MHAADSHVNAPNPASDSPYPVWDRLQPVMPGCGTGFSLSCPTGFGLPESSPTEKGRIGAAETIERAVGASAGMDAESEADTQRAEAWRAEANVKREGLGSHEPARASWLCAVLLAMFPGFASAADAPPTYEEHVLPIFREKCGSCHNADKKQGGLDLTSFGQALAGGSSGEVITPGDPDGSYLWQLASHSAEPKMPPQSDRIPGEMLDVLKKWIAGGAIERAGGQPITRKTNAAIALDPAAVASPSGPAVMPPRLSLDVETVGSKPLAITGLAASPNGALVAVGGRGQVLLYDASSLAFLGVLPFPEGDVKTLRFSRNAKLLLAGGGRGAKSGRVVLWDVATAKRAGERGDEFDQVLAADMTADQRLVALGGPHKVVRLLRTADGQVESEIRKHTDWITAVEFSPDGAMLATGDRAGNAFLWETRGAREDSTLKGHGGGITAVAWRGDGTVVATASDDGKVRLWARKDGAKIREWDAHPGGALGLAWLPDGRLATCGRDRKAALWKGDGTKEREFPQHADIALRVAVTGDGTRLFVGDLAGTLVASSTADAKPLGTPDTNPPRLEQRVTAAEASRAGRAQAHTAADQTLLEARKALEAELAKVAEAEKRVNELAAAAEQARAALTAAEADAKKWRDEAEFAKQRR